MTIIDPLERYVTFTILHKACVILLSRLLYSSRFGRGSSFDSWPFKPHFAYASGKAPIELEHLAEEIKQAHAYVCVISRVQPLYEPCSGRNIELLQALPCSPISRV